MFPHILDLGIWSRWVASFTTRPFYPRGKSRSHITLIATICKET